MQIDPAGPVCGCGRRGCLEAVAGIGAVAGARFALARTEVELELDEVVRRAGAGDARTLGRARRRVGRDLGNGVAILANLLNPEVVVLGGYYVPLAPLAAARGRGRAARAHDRARGRRLPRRGLRPGLRRGRPGRCGQGARLR